MENQLTAVVYLLVDGNICKVIITDGTYSQTRDFVVEEIKQATEFAEQAADKLNVKVLKMIVK